MGLTVRAAGNQGRESSVVLVRPEGLTVLLRLGWAGRDGGRRKVGGGGRRFQWVAEGRARL